MGLAKFIHDTSTKDGGEWRMLQGFLTINEENRALTSQELTISLSQAQTYAKTPLMKKFLIFGDPKDWPSNWPLGHNNPIRVLPKYIAPWTQPRLLSVAIEAGCYDSRGSTSKLYTIWLYYMPEAPPTPESSPSPPPKPIKKEKKKGKVKAECNAKEEIKQEPTQAKRSRSVSAETSMAKRLGLSTRTKTKVLEEVREIYRGRFRWLQLQIMLQLMMMWWGRMDRGNNRGYFHVRKRQ